MTRAERLASGNLRLSLVERYATDDGYVQAVASAARQLMEERLLLEEDVERYEDEASNSDILR